MAEGILAGTPAYWRTEGKGDRRALLFHCTLAHSGAWKGLMANLSDILSMEAMDLPGHGRSGGRDLSQSWQSQSVDMGVDLIRQGRAPVDLIGHSFGATIAIRLTVEHPELVRSLTLIEPVFFSAVRDAGRPEFETQMKDSQTFYNFLLAGDFVQATKAFSALWGSDAKWEDLPEKQQTYMVDRITMVRDSDQAALGLGKEYIPLSEVAKIKVPVFLVEGSQSDAVIRSVQDVLEETLSNTSRLIVKGAGHMVPISHANEVAAKLRVFLSKA